MSLIHKKEARIFLKWLSTSQAAEAIANNIVGYFPMHKQLPKIANQRANSVLTILTTAEGTDVRWPLPLLNEGLPTGYDLMDENAKAVVLGKITPQQATDNLQQGLAKWFKPAQTCRPDKKGFGLW